MAFGAAAVIAFLVYLVLGRWFHGATLFVAAYDAGCITLLWYFWRLGLHGDPRLTRARATANDPGKNLLALLITVTVIVGLVSAIAIIGHGPSVRTQLEKWEAYVFAVLAIAIGWLLVHTVFTFRYAHMYWYDDDGDGVESGGLRFPGTDQPSDWDFAYFSFCIGTSFAVSDPQVTETRIRREVIVHSVISFAYNSLIIGMVINLFAGIFASLGSQPGK